MPGDKIRIPAGIKLPSDFNTISQSLKKWIKEHKKAALILGSMPVTVPLFYIADVWTLGSLAAALYDVKVRLAALSFFTTPEQKAAAAAHVDAYRYVLKHPFETGWIWLLGKNGILAPEIKQTWKWLNVVLGAGLTTGFIWLRFNKHKYGSNKNNARHVHGLEVVDNPAFGTTRWAGPDDVAHFCEFGPPQKGSGGVVLGKLGKRIIRIIPGKNSRKGELGLTGHVVGYGVTGSGKSYTFVRNNMIAGVEDGQSLVLIDPKGELYKTKGKWLESKGYKVYVFNLVNPENSHQWNPIMECRNDEEIAEMSSCMIENSAKDSHGYFVNKEIQLYEALAGLLKDGFPATQAHPRAVMTLASWSKEKLEQVFINAYREKKISETIYERWRGAASANLEEAKSGLTAKLKIITTKSLAALMSGHEIDLSSIGKGKTALFCILPVKGSEVLKPILSVFYMFLFNRLYELADQNDGQLPVEVRLILDELANVGKIPGFSEKISTARSLGILLQYILQGRSQLNDVYGIEGARNILASTPVSLLLGTAPDDEITQELFSNKLGEAAVQIKQYRKDVSTPIQTIELPKKTIIVGRRKLMEKYEIKEMNTKFCIADVQASKPMFMEKLGWTELPQASEIMKCGTRPVSEFIPPRPVEIELPEAEAYDDAASGGTDTGSLLWEVKKHKTNQALESSGKTFINNPDEQNAVEIESTRKGPEKASLENPGVETDDVDTQGFSVSKSIF